MTLTKTPLFELYRDIGARMVAFAGWEMPIQFKGLIHEHNSVREQAGLFDISHMGVFRLSGDNPKSKLQRLVPSNLNQIGPGEACYTVLTNENGGIIDDLIIYELYDKNKDQAHDLLIVINAACIQKDIQWISKYLLPEGISILDEKDNGILLALQGPKSLEIMQKLTSTPLKTIPRFSHRHIKLDSLKKNHQETVFISATGYTGEDGFEILLKRDTGRELWMRLLDEGVTPCGLGARDTLRLEAAMNLYGQEMNAETNPFEAGLGWLVHLEMPQQFIGRHALEQKSIEGTKRRLVGLKVQGRAIPRNGHQVFNGGSTVGTITSGTWSPTLKEPIALAYVPTDLGKVGSSLEIKIRNELYPAKVVKKPFYRKR